LNMIISTKTGYCPENCGYCAQSINSTAPIEKYTMMSKEQIIAGAKQAYDLKSGTYCIVASGRGPTSRELDNVVGAVKEIKETYKDTRSYDGVRTLRGVEIQQLIDAMRQRHDDNLYIFINNHTNVNDRYEADDKMNKVSNAKEPDIARISVAIE